MIYVKKGVKLHPAIAMAVVVAVVNEIMAQYGADCVITSGIEGTHSKGSLHYVGLALDFRGNHVDSAVRQAIIKEIRDSLGDDFDVIESNHGAIHIEYQPKTAIGA